MEDGVFNQAFQDIGQRIDESGVFIGCFLKDFEATSREQLIVLLERGLTPTSKVLDIGCGCLRCASWLIHFLEPGCYVGVEPNKAMLDLGFTHFSSLFDFERKQPRFVVDDSFSVPLEDPGQYFDFITCLSVWSHASKKHIEVMLDRFCELAPPGGQFVTSYIPPTREIPDYQGEKWVGMSHLSDLAGLVAHSPGWIANACSKRGLSMDQLSRGVFNQQWLALIKCG